MTQQMMGGLFERETDGQASRNILLDHRNPESNFFFEDIIKIGNVTFAPD